MSVDVGVGAGQGVARERLRARLAAALDDDGPAAERRDALLARAFWAGSATLTDPRDAAVASLAERRALATRSTRSDLGC